MMVLGGGGFLLSPGLALAGPATRSGSAYGAVATSHTYHAQPMHHSAARPATVRVSISIAAPAPAQPARGPLYITLRGPDGELRQFPVEGGSAAIQPTTVVIRSGGSVTIRLVTAK
jgi:hypothetical protein